jgi:hypothetical protein
MPHAAKIHTLMAISPPLGTRGNRENQNQQNVANEG